MLPFSSLADTRDAIFALRLMGEPLRLSTREDILARARELLLVKGSITSSEEAGFSMRMIQTCFSIMFSTKRHGAAHKCHTHSSDWREAACVSYTGSLPHASTSTLVSYFPDDTCIHSPQRYTVSLSSCGFIYTRSFNTFVFVNVGKRTVAGKWDITLKFHPYVTLSEYVDARAH